MNHSKSNPFIRHKVLTVFFFLICLMVVFRIVLPSIIKTVANNFMAKDSPYFSFHINDVDLKFLRGEYAVNGISGTMKKSGEHFLSIGSVKVNVPWKKLFDERIISSNVVIDNLNLAASQSLLDNAKLEGDRIKQKLAENKKENKEEKSKEESKVRLDFLALTNSKITIHDFMEFKGKEVRKISDINILATNLLPTKANSKTDFQLAAKLFGPAPLNLIGIANLKSVPPSFDLNVDLKKFDLPSINPLIKKKTQAFIHKGKLDLYSEIVSEGKTIKGYAKPFVSKLQMDMPKSGFNFKGLANKSADSLLKILLKDSQKNTIATRAPFTFNLDNKKLNLEIVPVLNKAVMNKVQKNIHPGIEDKLGQKGLGVDEGLIQAQEAR